VEGPFTSLYTWYEQRQLAEQYESRLGTLNLHPPPPDGPLPLAMRRLAREAKAYRLVSHQGQPIGRIDVSRLSLNMMVVNGTDHDSLTRGPGRDLRTFMPGEGRLVYIAGHRTTYLAPFAEIDDLRPGDGIKLTLPYGSFQYRITGHLIVAADDVSRLRSRGYEQLALQACHPRFFATGRYIAYARLVAVTVPNGRTYRLNVGRGWRGESGSSTHTTGT
jgi:sortase A